MFNTVLRQFLNLTLRFPAISFVGVPFLPNRKKMIWGTSANFMRKSKFPARGAPLLTFGAPRVNIPLTTPGLRDLD
jgi:hypothetical protein